MKNLLALVLLGSMSIACMAAEPQPTRPLQLHELTLDQATRPVSLTLLVFAARDFSLRVIDNAGGNDTAKFPDLPSAMNAHGCIAGCNGGFFTREPFLIQEGYLARTAQGRILTPKGYHAIGLKSATRSDQQALL